MLTGIVACALVLCGCLGAVLGATVHDCWPPRDRLRIVPDDRTRPVRDGHLFERGW